MGLQGRRCVYQHRFFYCRQTLPPWKPKRKTSGCGAEPHHQASPFDFGIIKGYSPVTRYGSSGNRRNIRLCSFDSEGKMVDWLAKSHNISADGLTYTFVLRDGLKFSNGILPKDFGGVSEEAFFKNPIGTGPFVVKTWDPAGDLTFSKDNYYWQQGKPYIVVRKG